MAHPRYVIYCDKADDEELAGLVFTEGPLARAEIRRLPSGQTNAPAGLEEFLKWERADWLVLRDGRLVASTEITRHGYTGDNGFQRFARLYRAASLGVPSIYFTPFSRARLNELDAGQSNPRNIAPEMFQGLLDLGRSRGVPSLAVRWPTDSEAEPIPLDDPAAASTLADLRLLVSGFATADVSSPDWTWIPSRFIEAMEVQAAIPHRQSEVRFVVDLPIEDITARDWLDRLLPDDYFGRGKADKLLARVALDLTDTREFVGKPPMRRFWEGSGKAQVLYLGYQWRPDPSCGLIAFSSALARAAGLPLIVVWPRVYTATDAPRYIALGALRDFAELGTGPIRDAADRLYLGESKIADFQNRVSIDDDQFGVYSPQSKIGRILADCADLVVFGDGLIAPP